MTVRQRRLSKILDSNAHGVEQVVPHSRGAPKTPLRASKNPLWRKVVRWVARALLPIVFLLSTARVVHVPKPPSHNPHIEASTSPVLLIMAHNRPDYLRRCLKSVLTNHPANGNWRIVVSIDMQDGAAHYDVADVVFHAQTGLTPFAIDLTIWFHDAAYPPDVPVHDDNLFFIDTLAYRRISRHYEWALRRIFATYSIDHVVILEDDMEVAPDFFGYFDALKHVLDADPTLFCVSAWNDNGKELLSVDPEQLHRTDFFPGLGWMLTRRVWTELADHWPDHFWDDWLRSEDQTKGRQCVRPEVSRTSNYGTVGASQSFHFEMHVSKVVLNQKPVNFSALDLNYLHSIAYETMVFERLSRAVLLRYSNYLVSRPQDADVIARYPVGNIESIGRRTGVMTDNRNGVFRTSYRGIIIIPWNGHWAFLIERGWEPPHGYSLGSKVCCEAGTRAA
jgi:alpha-1,3-mannosyl-glycoprotein beta-1,2-N-acetylglucosaminyltransferase